MKRKIGVAFVVIALCFSACAQKGAESAQQQWEAAPSDQTYASRENSETQSISSASAECFAFLEEETTSEEASGPASEESAEAGAENEGASMPASGSSQGAISLEEESAVEVVAPVQQSFVASLQAASAAEQIIAVIAEGTVAQVSVHCFDAELGWVQQLTAAGVVGYNGVGQASEGSLTTPEGVWPVGMAFGILPDPGSALPYTQVHENLYWVDDPNSAYYNQMVDVSAVTADWFSAEHLMDMTVSYAYCLEIGYNWDRTPGAGSAMFLHCGTGVPTAGCVAVPQEDMVAILQMVSSPAVFVIGTSETFYGY